MSSIGASTEAAFRSIYPTSKPSCMTMIAFLSYALLSSRLKTQRDPSWSFSQTGRIRTPITLQHKKRTAEDMADEARTLSSQARPAREYGKLI